MDHVSMEQVVYSTIKGIEYSFTTTVESGMKGLIRVNIGCRRVDPDVEEGSQGVDLNASQCRSMARMLEAAAEAAERSAKAHRGDVGGFETRHDP